MRDLSFTFRKSYKKEGEKDRTYYGNSTEQVTKPGQKEPEIVPCISVTLKNTPENFDELHKDVGGDKMVDKFIEAVYIEGFKGLVKSEIFLKLEKDSERDSKVRDEVIAKIERLADEFSYARVLSETLTAKSALDELNSPEMQELSKNDPIEFARRVTSILQSTRGVKAAA